MCLAMEGCCLSIKRPGRQRLLLVQPRLVELDGLWQCCFQTDELIGEMVDLGVVLRSSRQDLTCQKSELAEIIRQALDDRVSDKRLGGRTIANARDAQRSSKSDGVLLVEMKHPPPEVLAHNNLLVWRGWIQLVRITMYCRNVSIVEGGRLLTSALTAEALRKPYSQSKNGPRIKESTAVREVRSY